MIKKYSIGDIIQDKWSSEYFVIDEIDIYHNQIKIADLIPREVPGHESRLSIVHDFYRNDIEKYFRKLRRKEAKMVRVLYETSI